MMPKHALHTAAVRAALGLSACAVAFLLACSHSGGHSSGPAGTLDGQTAGGGDPFTPQDAVFRSATPVDDPAILITDYAYACEDEIAGRWVAGSRSLEIVVVGSPPNPQGGPIPFPTGRFPVGAFGPTTLSATVSYYPLDGSCN